MDAFCKVGQCGLRNAPGIRGFALLTSFSVAAMTLVWLADVTGWRHPVRTASVSPRSWTEGLVLPCGNALQKMVRGRWHQQEMTSSQHFRMKMFHMKVHLDHGLPTGLQRPDLKCGNVTFGPYSPPMHPLLWYRALCDQDGSTPCCYDHQCRDVPKESCDCPHCYDMRRAVQAEYAIWRPEDPACRLVDFPQEEVCRVLAGATLFFIGDSYVRHVYTALLLAVRGDEMSGAILPHAPPGIRAACHSIYMFTEKLCRHWLDRDATVCQGGTRVRFFEYVYIRQAADIHRTVLPLLNVSRRSLVFLGTGVHDNFRAEETKVKVLRPLLERLGGNRTYPRVLWAATHAPGMLKTPRIPEQNAESVVRYNREMEQFLKRWGVSVFDTFNMTDGVMSFDGAHYGLGVNRVKVRVLLAHLVELYLRRLW
ncbi:uncharacterized protein LOC143280522 [Babylonia areolata]|uniref:uncharacterized protein LOC143280522 n=1 Tax=Babylonia areolata TaxID=304850 RepID=UPI003FD307BC